MKVTQSVTTVADLRRFLRLIDLHDDVPDSSPVHARTRFGMQPQGPPLKELTVNTGDRPTEGKR